MERIRISFEDSLAIQKLGSFLSKTLEQADGKEISVVCIGSDRATGDALGPLSGRLLTGLSLPVEIYGTVRNPVAAGDLPDLADRLNRDQRFVLAIDASLGRLNDVGLITSWTGPLQPGAGVGKDLPSLGNISILGCVNIGAISPLQVLQSTRLGMVMDMSEVIAYSLGFALRAHFRRQEFRRSPTAAENHRSFLPGQGFFGRFGLQI